jgi:hypothetical protein
MTTTGAITLSNRHPDVLVLLAMRRSAAAQSSQFCRQPTLVLLKRSPRATVTIQEDSDTTTRRR